MSTSKQIWCVFSVDNNYDQPPCNLVAWWKEKPAFEVVLKTIGGSMEDEESILIAASIMKNEGEEQRFNGTDWRLVRVPEGYIL